jgi:rifampicin phosphotransferase
LKDFDHSRAQIDGSAHWTLDSMREPISPLEFSILPDIFVQGFTRAAKVLNLRCTPPRLLRFETYLYAADGEVFFPVDREIFNGEFGRIVANLHSVWSGAYLPEITRATDALAETDVESMSINDLIDHLHEAISITNRLFELHFSILWPAEAAIQAFEKLFGDLFDSEDSLSCYKLLQGFENTALRMGKGLWELSRELVRDVELREKILTDYSAFFESAAPSDNARRFHAKFRDFLKTFGKRSDHFGLRRPSLLEDPTPLIVELRKLCERGDTASPNVVTARLVQCRTEAVAEARKHLSNYPGLIRKLFEDLLTASQHAIVIREDHEYYIDSRTAFEIRRILAAIGRKLVERNFLRVSSDVFMLSIKELTELQSWPPARIAELVQSRANEMLQGTRTVPPESLGANSRSERDLAGDSGLSAGAVLKCLKGESASAGSATGRARVLHCLSDADRLAVGEILVTEVAHSGWAMVFSTAAGVVTDFGGILSHCAVVAREYGIPAVVGTRVATQVIPDGALIEIDGSRGTVKLL